MSALKRLNISLESIKPGDYSEAQSQTRDSFGYQWHKRDTYESDDVQEFARKWLVERYCNNDESQLEKWLEGGDKIIMDAGCGGGYSAIAFFGEHLNRNDYLGVDISNACEMASKRFQENGLKGDFIQCSLLETPVPDGSLDMIFSEGVLHHTDNTETALVTLSKKLKTGGKFLFYVYAKKAVIREYTDDYIRSFLKDHDNDSSWELLKPLTKLGKTLGELDVTIDVPEDIPFLGIKKGPQDLQRFFYWNICKLFYKKEFNEDEMNHMNFDWFRPTNCFRHTPEEVELFCKKAGLEIDFMNVEEAGITVVADKK